ncbi:MAG: hypothetical protein ACYDH5_12235 [Acidimicrobiales bacterium]
MPLKVAGTSRPNLARAHLAGAIGATGIVGAFLVSSVVTELAGGPAGTRLLHHTVVLGLPFLAACLATAGVTGRRLAGRSRSALVRRKQRRLQAAAAVGLLVLVPCALALDRLAARPATGYLFYGLEATEIVFGALNLSLLILNFRDGRRMRSRRSIRLAGQPTPSP